MKTKRSSRASILDIEDGAVHAVMGPNGSGKSTLSFVISGREGYDVTAGSAMLDGIDLLELEPEERAVAGLFLAFQYPVEIPGVGNMNFLRTALNAKRAARGETEVSAAQFLRLIKAKARTLNIHEDLLKRPINTGFSGGEKKRNEILQMAVLEPKMCILDETDSGLDVDAMKQVAGGRQRAAASGSFDTGHHPLPKAAEPHRTRQGAYHGRRADRQIRGPGACA